VRRHGVGNDACNAGSLSGGAVCGQRDGAGRQRQSLDSGVGARTGAARSTEAAPAAPTGPEGGRGGGGGTAARNWEGLRLRRKLRFNLFYIHGIRLD
jgi:hypothetical protein